MKYILLILDDEEYKLLAMKKQNKTWHDFLLEPFLKEEWEKEESEDEEIQD